MNVQDHINLVYRTADFVKEARTCFGGLVHSMMIKSLQVVSILIFVAFDQTINCPCISFSKKSILCLRTRSMVSTCEII